MKDWSEIIFNLKEQIEVREIGLSKKEFESFIEYCAALSNVNYPREELFFAGVRVYPIKH